MPGAWPVVVVMVPPDGVLWCGYDPGAPEPPAPTPTPAECGRTLATQGKAEAQSQRAAILAKTRALCAQLGCVPLTLEA